MNNYFASATHITEVGDARLRLARPSPPVLAGHPPKYRKHTGYLGGEVIVP